MSKLDIVKMLNSCHEGFWIVDKSLDFYLIESACSLKGVISKKHIDKFVTGFHSRSKFVVSLITDMLIEYHDSVQYLDMLISCDSDTRISYFRDILHLCDGYLFNEVFEWFKDKQYTDTQFYVLCFIANSYLNSEATEYLVKKCDNSKILLFIVKMLQRGYDIMVINNIVASTVKLTDISVKLLYYYLFHETINDLSMETKNVLLQIWDVEV